MPIRAIGNPELLAQVEQGIRLQVLTDRRVRNSALPVKAEEAEVHEREETEAGVPSFESAPPVTAPAGGASAPKTDSRDEMQPHKVIDPLRLTSAK